MNPFTAAAPARRFALDPTLLLSGAALALAFALPVPQHGAIAGLPSPCWFLHLTGLPCPGCGLTRAVVCCAHGQWREALLFHPLGPLTLAALLAVSGWRLARSFTPVAEIAPRAQLMLGVAALVLLLGTWAIRLAGLWPLP